MNIDPHSFLLLNAMLTKISDLLVIKSICPSSCSNKIARRNMQNMTNENYTDRNENTQNFRRKTKQKGNFFRSSTNGCCCITSMTWRSSFMFFPSSPCKALPLVPKQALWREAACPVGSRICEEYA
jgi:hypothetical protein